MRLTLFTAVAIAALFNGTAAQADEVFGGVLAHDVVTGITAREFGRIERGVDFQIGYRGDRFGGSANQWVPAPYVFGSVNTKGGTNFAAAGLSWKFGDKVYFRPGVGLAIHDGPTSVTLGERRVDFGSRILFEPEVAVGYQINDRLSAEASWIHLSHAKLFSPQNPGIDIIGVRMNYSFR